MPAQVEDSPQQPPPAPVQPAARALEPIPPEPVPAGGHPHSLGHDRWQWRRKIRADPRTRLVYRVLIALAGLLLIVAGLVTGPLPGPGGIPLVLLGLAVWASEFIWAHRLMQRFKAELHRFRRLSPVRKTAIIAGLAVVLLGAGWLSLSVVGVPGWMPEPVSGWLRALPGV